LASIVETSEDAIFGNDLDGTITIWNRAAEHLFGYTAKEVLGAPVTVLSPEDRHEGPKDTPLPADPIGNYDTVLRCKDGMLVDISLTISPLLGSDGALIGVSKIARDMTVRKRASERQGLLIGEMKHRLKNLAAIIDVLARQSRPREDDPAVDAFVEVFLGRLLALLSTGELMLSSPTLTVDLKQLFENVLTPFAELGGTKRISIKGPTVAVAEKTAGNLALAVHELATNAVKYGALKTHGGTISLEWFELSREDGTHIQIDWKEAVAGRIEKAPERSGFGSRVIRAAVTTEPDGKTELVFEPSGLRCQFRFRTSST
jgi:PAS domain S-box-containing protein